jgi:hypothetical protein
MAFRGVLPSLKVAYSCVSVHKTLQVLLGVADIGLVLEEEGASLLVEVPDSSCIDLVRGLRWSRATGHVRAGERRRTRQYSQRLCYRQVVCVDCI